MLAALKSATSSSAAKSAAKPEPAKPAKPTSEVARLQDQADAFTRKIELERRRGVDLETEIRKTKEKIDEQRRKMGGVDAAREDTVKTQRQIKILENRLDKALAKHNEALAKNKQLRLTVDDLRKERLVFDDIYEKLQHELEEKKLEMGNVIEVSNKAFEARDRAVHEMARLKTQANKEQAAFECEFAELGKQIEHDRRMKEFMRHRADDSEARAAEISRQAALAEAENNKKLVKSKWTLAKDRVSQGITAARVNSYAAAFATIAEFTGESDVEKLVEQFVEAEDENFRLFSYVNQLNAEIEKLEDSIAELTREIAKHRGESTTHDAEKARAVKALDERLRRAETRARMYDRKYATATATMGKLKDGAWRVFNKIGCNTEVNRSLLGEDGVTDHNVMQYLGVIEQRTNEILQMFAASRTARGRLATGDNTVSGKKTDGPNAGVGGDDAFAALLHAGPTSSTATASVLRIEPPSTTAPKADDDSEEEDDERPLTRDEIREKMLRALRRREAGEARSGSGAAAVTAKGGPAGTPRAAPKTPATTKTPGGRGKENASGR